MHGPEEAVAEEAGEEPAEEGAGVRCEEEVEGGGGRHGESVLGVGYHLLGRGGGGVNS